jgi:hypothetical protein
VTASPQSLQPRTEHTGLARAADPDHNPTYPRRIHFHERAKLEEALQTCDQRLNSALQKLSVVANHAQEPLFVRLYHQMQGARDQVAEAVRRLPLEVGGLYREDHERFEQAMAALERTWRRWEKAGV